MCARVQVDDEMADILDEREEKERERGGASAQDMHADDHTVSEARLVRN